MGILARAKSPPFSPLCHEYIGSLLYQYGGSNAHIEEQHQSSDRDRARDDQRVMTFAEWCDDNSFSESTGRRIRKAGTGPRFIELSDRRIGVTISENRRWQNARAARA